MTSEMKELIAQNPWAEQIIKQSFIAGYARALVNIANRLTTIADVSKKTAGQEADKFYKSLIEPQLPKAGEND